MVNAIYGPEGDAIFFGGLPVSGVWLNVCQRPESGIETNHHVDHDNIGALFVLTSSQYKNSDLIIHDDNDQNPKSVVMKRSHVIAGSWALNKHFCYVDVSVKKRISWVLYFDRRILSVKKHLPIFQN